MAYIYIYIYTNNTAAAAAATATVFIIIHACIYGFIMCFMYYVFIICLLRIYLFIINRQEGRICIGIRTEFESPRGPNLYKTRDRICRN